MASYRPRSPTRRYADPRASTGTMIASSFDARPPRYDRTYEAQPFSRQNYIDSGPDRATTSRTQYVVRPRQNSLMAEENRRASVIALDPRSRPIVQPLPRERARSPSNPSATAVRPREEPDRFLHPSAAGTRQNNNHQRHHSATPADMDRLVVANRSGRERGAYHRPEPSARKNYAAPRPAIRLNDGYSYTGPREQFERDYPSHPPERHETQARRERPLSVIELPEFKVPPSSRRDQAPPPASSRQLERIDRQDANRPVARPGIESEYDRSVDLPRRRHSVRNPILHQSRDDEYLVPKDDYDGRRGSRYPNSRFEEEDYSRPRDHDRDPRVSDARRQPRSRENSPDRLLASKSSGAGSEGRRMQRSRDNSPDRLQGKGLAPPSHDTKRKPRSRDSSPERSGISKGLAAIGLGGVAAAGLAGGLRKEPGEKEELSDSEARKERRRHRRREKEREREMREAEEAYADGPVSRDMLSPGREYADPALALERREPAGKDNNSDNNSQEEHHKSHRHRRRRSRREKAQDELAGPYLDQGPPGSQELQLQELEDPEEASDRRRRGQVEYQAPGREVAEQDFETRTMSPGENEDSRPRRVLLVEPVKDKEQEVKPKGILKPARQVPFPEDPNPTREGVAPLKEAGKEGVPPEARWTKISRMLVNPEALEQAKERFEEREDYVIVLRVISKEEIAKLAEKTREIRGKLSVTPLECPLTRCAETRELEWQEELEQRRRADKSHRSRHDESSDDSDLSSVNEKVEKPRLAIAPPPPPFFPPQQGTPLESRAYPPNPDPMSRSLPDLQARSAPDAQGKPLGDVLPVPLVDPVPDTYSQNV